MRNFFIHSLERIVTVIVVLMGFGVLVTGLGTMFSDIQGSGFLAGVMVWLFGSVYVLMMGGIMYLALGIHDNTRRTAEAVERLADKT